MILTTPMFSQIKIYYPNSKLHVLASQRNAQILDNNPNINKIYIFKKKPIHLLRLLFRLYNERYTFWIDPKDHYSRESMILALFSHAGTKIGYNKPNSAIFDIAIPSDKQNFNLHAIKRNISILEKIGIKAPELLKPELFIKEELNKEVELQFREIIPNLIVLNISAGDKSRYWTIEGWIHVSDFINKLNGFALLVYHPDDYSLAREIKNSSNTAILYQSDSIEKVVAIIRCAKLVVTPDTSIVHIASAFNIPIIALYSSIEWNVNKFHPLSDWCKIIEPKENQTIQEIKIGRVLRQVKAYFDEN